MTYASPHSRLLAFVLSAILLPLLVACGVAVDEPTATPAPPTAAPAPTATPDTSLLEDGGILIIKNAYDRLLDEYIEPLDSSRILDGAWTLFSQAAADQGLDLPEKPAFSDDRAADFDLFRAAYVPVASASPDATPLRYNSIRGMAEALQDCHTYFLSPVASDALEDARTGAGVVGIGVDLAGVPPLVTEVITAGPADRAGIRVGDLIREIDGQDAANFGPASAFDRLNGEEGTTVSVAIERPGEDSLIDLTITRERVDPPNVETDLLEGGIGYLRIRNFVDGGIAADVRQTLDAFETQGVTAWIMDIRGNPGGRLDPDAISLFVPEGVIVRDRDRAGELHEVIASGRALDLVRPMVLLTNNRTGSVSEVFAVALQEHAAAYVIGGSTNGCAGYTEVQPLGDGSSLAVTTHVNLGPVTGAELAGIGVTPDEAVARTADDIAALLDPQLDAAIAHLNAIGATQ
jgi:carboxyl-terminal processing protease